MEEYINDQLKMVIPCLKILIGTLVLGGVLKWATKEPKKNQTKK